MSHPPKPLFPFPYLPKKSLPVKAPIKDSDSKEVFKQTQSQIVGAQNSQDKDVKPLPEKSTAPVWNFERATPISAQEAQDIGELNNENDQA